MAFAPIVLTIHAGDTVTWQWNGSLFHTVTSTACQPSPCPGNATFDSGSNQAPFTFTHTFPTGGFTLDYVCLNHQAQGMTATLNILP
jgi:plastocyanin